MRTSHYILILLAFSTFIFAFGLGNMALTDPDESFYAETAREMLQENEWVTPMIFGKPQFEKPILYYWLIAISYKLFGINEFAARFPSAVFAVLGIVGIFYLGRLLFSSLCGFLSALITATNVQYIVFGRACVTDVVLSVFLLYAFLFALMGWADKTKGYFFLSAIMVGLGVLTKGPIALFIFAAVIFLYLIFGKQFGKLKEVPITLSILAMLAVVLPWYIMVYKANGSVFINEFFGFQNLTRFTHPEHRIGDTPFFYIPVILGGFAPWSIFLPFAAWRFFKKDKKESKVEAYKVFFAAWFLVVFLFFSISRTKLVTYIFPLFPVLSIMVGRFWEVFLINGEERAKLLKPMNVMYSILFLITLVGMAAAFMVIAYKGYTQAIVPALVSEGVFLIGIVIATVLHFNKKYFPSFIAINATLFCLTIPIVLLVLPVVGRHESSKDVCLRLNELMKPGEALGGECDQRRGLAFYTGITDIVDIHPYQEKKNFVNRDERVWGVIKLKHYNQLKEEKGAFLPPPVYIQGKRVIITNKPLETR